MVTLEERRKEFEAKVTGLYGKVEKMQRALDKASALVVQLLLLEVALQDPSITEFSFDANFEYDDEGSYFWSVSFTSDGDNEDADPWERFEAVEQYASEAATQIAFNSKSGFDGTITVADLQEAVAAAGP